MGKYYVVSGELEIVLAGEHLESARQAACEAVLMFRDKQLAPLIVVSERGLDLFTHKDNTDQVFSTIDIAKEEGILEN